MAPTRKNASQPRPSSPSIDVCTFLVLRCRAKATPASLKHIQALPLEYLQLGEGFDKSESLPMIAGIKALKRLTLTNCRATTT